MKLEFEFWIQKMEWFNEDTTAEPSSAAWDIRAFDDFLDLDF